MDIPKIEEPTLYPPIIEFLRSIGFKAVGQTAVGEKEPDILFELDSTSFVVEVKIGKPNIGLKAAAQAWNYAKRLGTQNIILLIYPEQYRDIVLLPQTFEAVGNFALNRDIDILISTDYWTEKVRRKPKDVFEELKRKILQKTVDIHFDTVVKLIENYVMDLNSVIYQIKTEEVISEVVKKLDLFSSIGEIKDEETAKNQVMNLASYLIFNQLLFYHIYKRKTKSPDLDELEEITKTKDLQKYFDSITKIDYQSIYKINILGHMPENQVVLDTLNDVIKAIKLLRAEHITHDLAGRFFHDLLPYEVRKVLAAFYTNPNAAEILAGLSIDSWDERIIDPACGSGTLLVSAYRRKQELYEKLYGYTKVGKMHKKFVEEDLTGIDIMPFAAHISTINLATQDIEEKTNIVRMATLDSLELADFSKSTDFKRKGIKISPYTTSIQLTLNELYGKPEKIKKRGSVSPEGKGSEFHIKPVDVVIMNPPFTDRHKLPKEIREKYSKNLTITKICGQEINLWGYFLVLADLLLKSEGRIAAVIPINIARGRSTEKIRKYLLENYHVEYIIKSTKDLAFSESAQFRDILVIAKKVKPKEGDLTAIVFLNKSIRGPSLEEIKKIVEKIKKSKPAGGRYTDEEFSIEMVPLSELKNKMDNLMLYLGGMSLENMDNFRNFIDIFTKKAKNKLSALDFEALKEGITSPEGLAQLVYVTNPSDENRVKRAFLITEDDNKDLLAKIKDANLSVRIPKAVVKPALRTLTGIKNMDISNKHDYIIFDNYKDFETAATLSSKWKGKFNWDVIQRKIKMVGYSRLVIPDKLNLSSPNTFLLSAYSENPLVLSNLFFTYNNLEKEVCKILSLSLNSILTLSQFITFKSETLGTYIRLSATDWNLTLQVDPIKLNKTEKKIVLDLFDKIKDVEFPSLLEQIETRFWARVELDKTILSILGFSKEEINELLPKLYDALVKEFKAMKSIE